MDPISAHPAGKVDVQLRVDYAPVFASAGPFLCDVYHCQIQHFEQGIVCRKYGFGFRDFPELSVEAFDYVRGVYERPYFLRVFEVGA